MKTVLAAVAAVAVLAAGGVGAAVLHAKAPAAATSSVSPGPAPPEEGDAADVGADQQDGKQAEKSARKAAQRAFVAAKKEWTACVAGRPAGEESHPEATCGAKPRNPMAAVKPEKKPGDDHGNHGHRGAHSSAQGQQA